MSSSPLLPTNGPAPSPSGGSSIIPASTPPSCGSSLALLVPDVDSDDGSEIFFTQSGNSYVVDRCDQSEKADNRPAKKNVIVPRLRLPGADDLEQSDEDASSSSEDADSTSSDDCSVLPQADPVDPPRRIAIDLNALLHFDGHSPPRSKPRPAGQLPSSIASPSVVWRHDGVDKRYYPQDGERLRGEVHPARTRAYGSHNSCLRTSGRVGTRARPSTPTPGDHDADAQGDEDDEVQHPSRAPSMEKQCSLDQMDTPDADRDAKVARIKARRERRRKWRSGADLEGTQARRSLGSAIVGAFRRTFHKRTTTSRCF